MKTTREKRRETTSATLAPTLWLVGACSLAFIAVGYGADPAWWGSTGLGGAPLAVEEPVVATNNGVVTTNYPAGYGQNENAVVVVGQLKRFTVRAVDEMNARLPGGAGAALNGLVAGWAADYAANGAGYNASTNAFAPYKPGDLNMVNIGQVKYIGNLVWSQLVANGYTNAVPSWLARNPNVDYHLAVIGQMKEVFNFDLSNVNLVNTVTNVSAALNGDGSVTLSWSFSGAGGGGPVAIGGLDASGNWDTLATLGPDATSETIAASQVAGFGSFGVSNLASGIFGAAQAALGNNPGQVIPRYAVLDLGTNFFPTGLNNRGMVVGNDASGNGYEWSSGTMTMLQSLYPPYSTSVTGIDDDGEIVGGGNAFWQNAGSTPLFLGAQGLQGGIAYDVDFSQINAISADGFIVGISDLNASGYGPDTPSSFDPATTYVSDLPGGWPFGGAAYASNLQNGQFYYFATAAGGSTHWVGYASAYYNAETNFPALYHDQTIDYPLMDGFIYMNVPGVSFAAINANDVAAGRNGDQAAIFISAPYFYTNLAPGAASYLNDLTPPQVIGGDASGNAMLWDTNAPSGQAATGTATTATYTGKLINTLIANNSTAAWNVTNLAGINNAGAIVGTATASGTNGSIAVGTTTYSSPATPPAAGSHGVLLLPLQLTVLNGLTPDFDGTIITTVIPAPENPKYANDIAFCGGSAVMGVLPMGQGRESFPNEAYTEQTLVAAKAPASITGIQYQWKRYISRRSWYIQMGTGGTSCTVTWRSSRGTASPEDLLTNGDDTGSSDSYNTTPSSVKYEFYFHDSSAIVYGGGAHDQDGTMKVGDFIHEEKAFIYVLQTSFDGTTWTDGISINTAQSETIKYRATGGTAVTDWVGVPNLQAGNTYIQGNIVPTITTAKVQAIVGSTVSVTIASDANTH